MFFDFSRFEKQLQNFKRIAEMVKSLWKKFMVKINNRYDQINFQIHQTNEEASK